MGDMRIIENGLIPIYATDEADGIVNARELHEFLQSGRDFSNWIQDRIAKYSFDEGVDFSTELLKTPSGGRPKTEYFLSMGMAKEIAMVENNERGRRVRHYFIEAEKRSREATRFQIPKTYAEALHLAANQADQIETQKATIAQLEPKAAFHDQVADTTNCIDIARFAKLLGTGEIRFFAWLRNEGILMANNVPYQRYIDEGYFKVREKTYSPKNVDNPERMSYTQTAVTGKGQTYLQKRWAKDGNAVQLRLVEA